MREPIACALLLILLPLPVAQAEETDLPEWTATQGQNPEPQQLRTLKLQNCGFVEFRQHDRRAAVGRIQHQDLTALGLNDIGIRIRVVPAADIASKGKRLALIGRNSDRQRCPQVHVIVVDEHQMAVLQFLNIHIRRGSKIFLDEFNRSFT